MVTVLSLSFISCSDDEELEPANSNYGLININGKDYACYGYGMPVTYSSTWENGTLSILLPLGELADAKKGEYDYDYMVDFECKGGDKPKVNTNLANYSNIDVTIVLKSSEFAVYESGSAIVKSISDDNYITIEFSNFKCKASSTSSYTLNGTVKLDYDVD